MKMTRPDKNTSTATPSKTKALPEAIPHPYPAVLREQVMMPPINLPILEMVATMSEDHQVHVQQVQHRCIYSGSLLSD